MSQSREFDRALLNAGVSVVEFAAELAVTRQAIYQVLKNPKKSKRLGKVIRSFIRKHHGSAVHATSRRAA